MKRNRVIASWSELALVELQDDERKRRNVIVVMSKNDEDDGCGKGNIDETHDGDDDNLIVYILLFAQSVC